MNDDSAPVDCGNPFTTRRTRPGAMPFLFPPGCNADTLIAALASGGWRGAIVGPHGSGKSALLATLVPAIEQAGRRVLQTTLHDGQRAMPPGWDDGAAAGEPAVVVVDGYEQLSRWSRSRLARTCRRRDWGLLVTSHAPVGLPIIRQTEPDLDVARQVVAELTRHLSHPIPDAEIAARFEKHRGDLREMLFDLYDYCEQRHSLPATNDAAGRE